AGGAEATARLPGGGIERDEPGIDRRDEDTPMARLAIAAARIAPERDAAVERRAQIHRAIGDDRRGFELAFRAETSLAGDIAGVVLPSDLQRRDVRLVDLGKRRIAHPAGVAAIEPPIRDGSAGRRLRERRIARAQGGDEECEN